MIRRGLVLLGFLAVLSAADASERRAVAAEPAYLLLRPTPAVHGHGPAHGPSPTVGIQLSAPPYPYGWFGARPPRYWRKHNGYYGNYTQWSGR